MNVKKETYENGVTVWQFKGLETTLQHYSRTNTENFYYLYSRYIENEIDEKQIKELHTILTECLKIIKEHKK